MSCGEGERLFRFDLRLLSDNPAYHEVTRRAIVSKRSAWFHTIGIYQGYCVADNFSGRLAYPHFVMNGCNWPVDEVAEGYFVVALTNEKPG